MSRKLGGFAVVGAVGVTLAMPAAAQSRGERRITPYIEVGQVLSADSVTNDLLTYSEVSAGLDANIDTRRVRIGVSYRYDRRFSWDDQVIDNSSHNGVARGSVAVAPGLTIDGGAVATSVRADIRGGQPGLNVGTVGNGAQTFSGDVGPSFNGRAGPVGMSASYRYGYTKVEAPAIPDPVTGRRVDLFDSSQRHLAQASVGVKPGTVLPVGLSAGGAYEREDSAQLDGRYEGAYGRGDLIVPLTPTLAAVGGVGYEKIEVTQRDAVVNAAGDPVVDSNGRYITNGASPRRIAYDTEGVFWDAGVVYRPSPRTTFQARVGRRYDSMTYTGSLSYQASNNLGVNIGVYDGIQSFGRQLRGGLAGIPINFQTANDPLGQTFGGCLFGVAGAGAGAGGCLAPALTSATAANFRARGVDGVVSASYGRTAFGFGFGYANRKYLVPNGAPGTVVTNGSQDENAYANAFFSQVLTPVSSWSANVFANYASSEVPGAVAVYSAGASSSYTHRFGRLGATASFGIYGNDTKLTEIQYQSLARVGLRYGF